MRKSLSLAVAESSLHMSLVASAGLAGIRSMRTIPAAELASIEEPFDGSSVGLTAAMRRLASRMQDCGVRLRGAQVHALLSSAFSGIGLIPLSPEVAAGLTSAGQEQLAKTWATLVARLDCNKYELRSKILEHGRSLLAMAVELQILSTLENVTAECGAQLASCRPAVAASLALTRRALARSRTSRTVLWLEHGVAPASGTWLQLLHIDAAGQLNGHFRCWLPARDAKSLPLIKGYVDRFRISHDLDASTPPEHVTWPPQRDIGVTHVLS